jgi:hypothetical protein
LGQDISDEELTPVDIARLNGQLVAEERRMLLEARQQSSPVVASLKADWQQVYLIQPKDMDVRWTRFKKHVLQEDIEDHALTSKQLEALQSYVTKDRQQSRYAS